MRREIKDHITNPVNDRIIIRVMDDPGPGGASHLYYVYIPEIMGPGLELHFQEGPTAEAGVNGITQEVLLAIVIDRLRAFQAGPFPSNYNDSALMHCEQALEQLKARTRERMARGVEGHSVA